MQAPPLPPTPQELAAHAQELQREVLSVRPGVWVAVGYGFANAILLEGDTGAVVVDTLGSVEQARLVREAFAKVSSKPIVGIIYTHHHPDHVNGAAAFAEGETQPPVYAHADLVARMQETVDPLGSIRDVVRARMLGTQLSAEERLHGGIGLQPDRGTPGYLPPTVVVSEPTTVELGGMQLELLPAPGETTDHLAVWIPQWQVLLPGDNFYRAFPLLHPPEGPAADRVLTWANTLERLRSLGAVHLVPSHTRPLSGEDTVAAALSDYRDAMRWVRDQTLRAMNVGMGPEEIATQLLLPPHLATSPYLQPFYGTPAWMSRAVYASTLGWFNGNASSLQPLSPRERARRMVSLAGGPQGVQAALTGAIEAQDYAWVLELTEHLLALDPEDDAAEAYQTQALEQLAQRAINANARHYYLTRARELQGRVKIPTVHRVDPSLLPSISMGHFFNVLAARLDGRLAAEKNTRLAITFPDLGESYTLWIRRGVLEVSPGVAPQAEVELQMSALMFKEMVAGSRNAARTLTADAELKKGGRLDLMQFFATFQLHVPG